MRRSPVQGSSGIFLLLALLAEGAAVAFLELSRGLARRVPALATIAFYILGLASLTLALDVRGFALGLIYAAWTGVGIVATAAIEHRWRRDEAWGGKDVGPVGTVARVGLGLGLAGSVVAGQLATHFAPLPWLLGLVAFPGLALAAHAWRVRNHPAPYRDSGPLAFALSVAPPVALYLTCWYAPALAAASDGKLLFLGLSMTLAALRGSGGCDMLATSNWLLRRRDQIGCALLTPIDSLDQGVRRFEAPRQGGVWSW
jgi:multidrug transporter EmrE-like cation transporter